MNRNQMGMNRFLWAMAAAVVLGFCALPSHAVTITDGATLVCTSATDAVLGAPGETIVFEGTSELCLSNTVDNYVWNFTGRTMQFNNSTSTITAKSKTGGQIPLYGPMIGSCALTLIVATGYGNPSWMFNGNKTFTGTCRVAGTGPFNLDCDRPFGDGNNPVLIDSGIGNVGFTYQTTRVVPYNLTITNGNFSPLYVFPPAIVTYGGNISGASYIMIGNQPGAIELTGTNTFTGGIQFSGTAATLMFSEATNLGSGSFYIVSMPGSGRPKVKISGAGTNSFETLVYVQNKSYEIEVTNASKVVTWNGELAAEAQTAGIIYKTGPGRLNFNRVGATDSGYVNFVVSNGVLGINFTNNLVGDVTVKSGGTLGGTGTLRGTGKSVTIESGGALAPGDSVGTLTVSNGTLFSNGAVAYDWDVDNAGQDLVACTDLNLSGLTAGTLRVRIAAGTTRKIRPTAFALFSYSGTLTGFDSGKWSVTLTPDQRSGYELVNPQVLDNGTGMVFLTGLQTLPRGTVITVR